MRVIYIGTPTVASVGKYKELFKEHDIEYVEYFDIPFDDEDAIVEAAKGAVGIITTVHKIPRSIIERLDDSVKFINRIALGYEIIDVEAACEKGIAVCNVPDYGVQEVAVHTCALMLSAIRKIPMYNALLKTGWWKKIGLQSGHTVKRVSTQCLGLLGFGNIARHVAKYMSGFDMRTIAYDPYLDDSVFKEWGVERAETAEEVYKNADIISIHIPLFKETYHMVDDAAIEKMKDGVTIINTARGELLDSDALLRGLKSGKVRTAALDVVEGEPVGDADAELFKLDNLIVTPHIAYYSESSAEDLQRKGVEIAIDAAKGNIPYACVNKKQITKN